MKKSKKQEAIKKRKIKHFTYFFALLNLVVVFLFFDNPRVASGMLLALGVWGLLIWNSKRTLFVFLFGAVLGIFAEIVMTAAGILEYSVTIFLGTPLWTSLFLGNAAAFIYQKITEVKEGRIN